MIFNKLFGKYKFVTMSVILGLLVVSLVFVIVYFYGGNRQENREGTTIRESLVSDDGTLSGDSCFLVVCNDNNSSDIVFMFLADFRIYSAKLIITPLSAETVSADGRTYNDIYSYGGINLLEKSVEDVRNVIIDRYAVLDRAGVSTLTELVGEIRLNVSEDFTYQSSDKSYEVKVGEAEMGSDMLFTYMKLYSEKYGEQMFASLICEMINTYLVGIETDDIEDMFSGITNCFDTNVTISDYYTAKNDIEYIVEHNIQCVMINDVDR